MNVLTALKQHWPAAAIAVLLNLVPIIGVLFWGWSAFALVFLYWLENVVIGLRTVVQMLATSLITRKPNFGAALFFCAFFCVHYGIFCFGHGTFVVGMFGQDESGGFGDLPGTVVSLIQSQSNLMWGLASISIWQVVKLIIFLASGRAGRTHVLALMAAPYPRIIILHLAIIGAGFLLILFNEPIAGLVALALLKTAFDVADALQVGPLSQSFGLKIDPATGLPPRTSAQQKPGHQDDA